MILITRPNEDASGLSTKLNTLKLDNIILPLVEIFYQENIAQILYKYLENTKNIIITSKNSLRALPNDINKNVVLNLVGVSTASLAEDLGFTNINIVEKDVKSLISAISKSYILNSKFIYLRGNLISYEIKSILASMYNIDELICYNSVFARQNAIKLINIISKNLLDMILFFSPKTAFYFLQIIKKYNKEDKLKKVKLLSLSYNISSMLNNFGLNNILTAKEPNENSIIKLIQEIKNE